MLGTIVNTVAVLIGSSIGLLIKKGLSEKISKTIMTGIALCVLYIGISGSLEGNHTIIIILSMVLGAIIGGFIDLDGKLNQLGNKLESKFKNSDKETSIAEGFISSSLLFCVGAMSIVGALQSGLTGNHEMLYTKSVLDFISSIIFASSLGVGVIFSSVFVLTYQGLIVLLSQSIAPFLGDAVVSEMTCVGSLLIIALALNMLGLTKIKVMNYVPAIFLPILLMLLVT